MHLLVAAALSFVIGATVGLLGGGGSMLTLPMLVYVLGVAPPSAISATLLVVAVTSVTGVLVHASEGRVAWRIGAIFGLAGMAGAYAGGHLARLIPGRVAAIAFGALMLVTSAAMIRGREARGASAALSRHSLLAWIAVGVVVGVLSGVLGAGGSFLIVPALQIAGGLGMLEAIATSPLVAGMQSLAGFVGRLEHFDLDLRILAAVAVIAVIGSFAGARTAPRLSATTLRRGFGCLIFGIALFLLAQQLSQGAVPSGERAVHGGCRASPPGP